MEGEQEGGRKVEKKRNRRGKTGAATKPATTFGVAEEATIASAGNNGACSDGRGGENKCGSDKGAGAGVGQRMGTPPR